MRVTSLCTAILLLVATNGFSTAYAASDSAKATVLIAQTQVLSLRLVTVANDAAGGNVDAFKNLKQTSDSVAANVTRLGSLADRDLAVAAAQLVADAGKVLDGQENVLAAATAAAEINSKLPVFNSRIDEAVKILAEQGGSGSQVMIVCRQMRLVDRMQRRMQAILNAGEESSSAAEGLQRDAQFYGVVQTSLIKGNKDLDIKKVANVNALGILTDIDTQWTQLAPTIAKLLDVAPNLQDVRQAADKSTLDAQSVLERTDALMSRINE